MTLPQQKVTLQRNQARLHRMKGRTFSPPFPFSALCVDLVFPSAANQTFPIFVAKKPMQHDSLLNSGKGSGPYIGFLPAFLLAISRPREVTSGSQIKGISYVAQFF
jgi:hypothetical protein